MGVSSYRLAAAHMRLPGAYLTTAVAFLLLSLVGPGTTGAGDDRYRPSSSTTILLARDQKTLFVANPDSASISVLDVGSRVKLAEIRVGRTPRTMALSPDGRRLLVTCQESNHVAVVDTSTFEVQQFIDVSAEPYGVVTGSRGHYAYVTSSALGVVDVIHFAGDSLSLETFDNVELLEEKPDRVRASYNRVVRSIRVEAKPAGVARSADGQRLYVTHLRTGRVSVIDLNRQAVVKVVGTGSDSNMTQRIAVHPDNGRAYVPHIRSNVTNRFRLFDSTVFPVISVLDLRTGTHLTRERIDLSLGLTVANLPFDVQFSADGKQIYVVNLSSGDVMIHDIETGRRIAGIDVGHGPRGIAVSLDGTTGYVNNSMTGEVSILDLHQFKETPRIRITDIPLPEDVQRGKIVFLLEPVARGLQGPLDQLRHLSLRSRTRRPHVVHGTGPAQYHQPRRVRPDRPPALERGPRRSTGLRAHHSRSSSRNRASRRWNPTPRHRLSEPGAVPRPGCNGRICESAQAEEKPLHVWIRKT